MIHFSALDAIKCPYIKPGDQVVCEVVEGRSGLQALRVIEVRYGSSEARSLATVFSPRLTPEELENLEEIEGTLKWYNHDKGYGFISPHDGSSEIFVHFSVVREAGYKFLEPGIRVLAKISQSDRGPEARTIRVLHTAE
jgi:CspA family cold shock protein